MHQFRSLTICSILCLQMPACRYLCTALMATRSGATGVCEPSWGCCESDPHRSSEEWQIPSTTEPSLQLYGTSRCSFLPRPSSLPRLSPCKSTLFPSEGEALPPGPLLGCCQFRGIPGGGKGSYLAVAGTVPAHLLWEIVHRSINPRGLRKGVCVQGHEL
jgi:hypothetical protein